MKKVYIVFEWWDDVFCENNIDTGRINAKGKPILKTCGQKNHTSRIVRFVTTDRSLAITYSRHKPNWGYQTHDLWTDW